MSNCCWWCWSPGGCAAGCCPHWGCPSLSCCLPSFGTGYNPELCRQQAAPRGLDLPNTPWPATRSLPHHPPGYSSLFLSALLFRQEIIKCLKCVSGGERGEAVGSALVPVKNAFLSMYELQFGHRKCIEESKLVQKKWDNDFTSCRKSSAGEQALSMCIYNARTKKVVSNVVSP